MVDRPVFMVKGMAPMVMKVSLAVRWPLPSSQWSGKQPLETEARCTPACRSLVLAHLELLLGWLYGQ